MTNFAIAALQLELDHGDNIDAIAEELRELKRRFPWVEMVVLGELAAFGPRLAYAQPMPGPHDAGYQPGRRNRHPLPEDVSFPPL